MRPVPGSWSSIKRIDLENDTSPCRRQRSQMSEVWTEVPIFPGTERSGDELILLEGCLPSTQSKTSRSTARFDGSHHIQAQVP